MFVCCCTNSVFSPKKKIKKKKKKNRERDEKEPRSHLPDLSDEFRETNLSPGPSSYLPGVLRTNEINEKLLPRVLHPWL
jgi:hypothetical protein